jgi:ring-1,2-phenylacetyl-CoA epoxidase subunit PaaC
MKPELRQALAVRLLAMADDELILGHRDSEWTGHAPIIEEDIALANIAQDEIGHAIIWYTLAANLLGENPDTYADRQVFFRAAPDYRNVQLVELPIGDWAFTLVRQYLFDAAEAVHLEQLRQSAYEPLAGVAAKIYKEEIYHYRHCFTWLQRLGLGSDESHRRTQAALTQLWPYALQLFEPAPDEVSLVEAGYVPNLAQLQLAWENLALPALEGAGLVVPPAAAPSAPRRSQHTGHLTVLLAEMQEVARLDPEAQW